jgi:transcriptional regulator with XRE-family HTH domain
MKLADWLKERGQTQAMFAGRIGASQSYIAELCAGNKRPSLRTAQMIAAVTNGQVMPEDFFKTGEAA